MPAGTVNFTVSDTAGGTPITGSVAVDGAGVATFTPLPALAAGTYDVTATFTPSNADYMASSSGVLLETVAAANTVGVGTVSAGTSTAPVSLRGGAQATIDVTQAIDSTGTVLSESGAGVSYTDAARGISITGATVTSVIFSSNGYQAEIIGTGSNVNGTTTTPVSFVMLVNSGSGQGRSTPSISMTITGTGINYQQSARVVAGSVSVNETGSTTTILPSGKLGSGGGGGGQGGWGQGGWGQGGGGQGGGGQGDPAPGGSGQGSGGQGGGGSGGSGSGGSGSTGSGSGGSGSTGSGSTGSGGSGSGASSSETSSNWSGYAAATSLSNPQTDSVTAVSGTWIMPTATAGGNTTAYASVWVGIDGYSSNSVEQIGADADIVNGKATYYAWYEMYPSDSVNITSMTISAGDSITASVQYLSSGAHAGKFQLTITDTSKANDSFTIYETDAQAQRSSAEWVVEAPSSGYGVLPLANFGSVAFTNASATIDGKTGAIDSSSWQSSAITMAAGSGVEASVSALTDSGGTSSFTDTYHSSGGATSRSTVQAPSRSNMLRQSTAALANGGSSQSAFENDLGLRARDAFFATLSGLRV